MPKFLLSDEVRTETTIAVSDHFPLKSGEILQVRDYSGHIVERIEIGRFDSDLSKELNKKIFDATVYTKVR